VVKAAVVDPVALHVDPRGVDVEGLGDRDEEAPVAPARASRIGGRMGELADGDLDLCLAVDDGPVGVEETTVQTLDVIVSHATTVGAAWAGRVGFASVGAAQIHRIQ
jgi:hypothetical protein